MRALIMAGLLIGFMPTAWAQTPVSADVSTEVSADKKALILKLMEITGSRNALMQSLSFMKKSFPPKMAVAMDKVISIDDLLDKLIPIYARNLSTEELQGLIKFYESDLGHKYIQVSPLIMKESMQAGQDYFKSKLPQLKAAENQG